MVHIIHLTEIYAEVGDFDEAAKIRNEGIAYYKKYEDFSATQIELTYRARLEYVYLESMGRFRDAEQFHQGSSASSVD